MLKGIDHLVFAVSDLDSGIRDFSKQGYTVVMGGRHPTSTHNALIGFEDGSYIELLAFYERDEQHHWWKSAQRGGWIDFCAETDAIIEEDTIKFQRAGVHMQSPRSLSRLRPDGYQLQWVNTNVYGRHQGIVPFLIKDQTSREERAPKETSHANRATGIDTITIVVENLSSIQKIYADVLQNSGETFRREDLGATGARFTIGPHILDFITPARAESPLHAWLESRGDSIYAVSLKTKSGDLLHVL